MGMSEFYVGGSDAESIATIHHAIDRGVTFLDTADMYGWGKNEELVGEAIRDRRDEVFLATKFGNVRGPNGEFLGVRGDPEYVRSACEASLKRLGVEVDRPLLPASRRHQGADRGHGRRNGAAEGGREGPLPRPQRSRARRRSAGRRRCTRSPRSRPSCRCGAATPKRRCCRRCRELGIGYVAYSPLGRGFLTGQFKSPDDFPEDDFRKNHPRFQGENFDKNLDLVREVEKMAEAKGCTTAQLALAWVLAQGDDVVPIPGTKHVKYLDQNIGALEVRLSARGPRAAGRDPAARRRRRRALPRARAWRRSTARRPAPRPRP